jgi:hypothetical protein
MPFSRVIEVELATKKIVWEYREKREIDFFSPRISNAQRLPNGNTMPVPIMDKAPYEANAKYTSPTTVRNFASLPSSVRSNLHSTRPSISRPKPTNIQAAAVFILIGSNPSVIVSQETALAKPACRRKSRKPSRSFRTAKPFEPAV